MDDDKLAKKLLEFNVTEHRIAGLWCKWRIESTLASDEVRDDRLIRYFTGFLFFGNTIRSGNLYAIRLGLPSIAAGVQFFEFFS